MKTKNFFSFILVMTLAMSSLFARNISTNTKVSLTNTSVTTIRYDKVTLKGMNDTNYITSDQTIFVVLDLNNKKVIVYNRDTNVATEHRVVNMAVLPETIELLTVYNQNSKGVIIIKGKEGAIPEINVAFEGEGVMYLK